MAIKTKAPITGTTIPVRPWLFVCFIVVVIGALASYVYRFVTEQYLPVINSGVPRTPAPTGTPALAAWQLSPPTPVYNYGASNGTPVAPASLIPPLLMDGTTPFASISFGSNARVLTYKPEFIIGDARIAEDGLLYVSFDYAALDFVTLGMGPYTNKLAVLTAGVLRPIPAVWQQYGDITILNETTPPLIFTNNFDDFFFDYAGVYRLAHRYPQPIASARPSELAGGERCVAARNPKLAMVDAVSPNGQRRVLISRDESNRLSIRPDAEIRCFHFAGRNIFEIRNQRNTEGDVNVEIDGHLKFLVTGTVLAAGDHRLLIRKWGGGNHQWLLEGFAL